MDCMEMKMFKSFKSTLNLLCKHLCMVKSKENVKNGFNSSNLFLIYNSLDFEKQNRHYQKLKNSLKEDKNEV